MSYNVANFDQTVHSDGIQGTVQVSDGNLGFEGAKGITINSLGDITANAFFGYTSGGGGGGGATPSLQAVTVVGASTNRAVTISNSLTVTGNLFVTGNLVSVDTENIVVQDPMIQLANNSTSDTSNVGIIFTRPTSNIVIGWRGNEDEVMIGFSTSSASGTDLDPLNDNKLNLKVYGNVEATGLLLGNANLLSNIVNSEVGPATYGNTTHVTQITITDNGRISAISNVEIQERSNLDQVVNRSNVTSNTLEVGGLYSSENVEAIGLFLGNANLLSNIVNSDVGPATYGNATHVTQITVSDTGRISAISNVEIQELSNLDQVVNRGNVTTNTLLLTNTENNIVASGNIHAVNFVGNGNLISNIVNSDVGPATYGNATHTTQITITPSGRISAISNIEIQELSNLDQVVNRGNVTSNTLLLTNTENNIVASGNIHAVNFVGNGNLISNIVNSDVGPATYGNATHTTQITITPSGRISAISNIEIQELSNLDQVVNRGNVTSNTLLLTNTGISMQTSGDIHMTSGASGSTANPIIELNRTAGGSNNYLGQLKFKGVNNATESIVYSQLTGQIVDSSDGTEDGLLEFSCMKAGTQTIVQKVVSDGVKLVNATPLVLENNSIIRIEETGFNNSHIFQQDGIVNIGNSDTVSKNNVLSINIVNSNVTAHGNLVVTGQANVANIVISQAVGAGPTVSSNIITVDQAGHTYKFFRLPAYPTNSLEGITIQNPTDGCQTLVDIYPIGGDLDVFQNFSNGGAGPTVLTSLNSNLVINTGNHVMISCVTDLSNTFVNIIGFY